jgi:hypothetical protein
LLVGVDVDFDIMAAIDVSMRSMERRMVDKRKAAELTPIARLVTCPVEDVRSRGGGLDDRDLEPTAELTRALMSRAFEVYSSFIALCVLHGSP